MANLIARNGRLSVVTCSRHTGEHLEREDCVMVVTIGRLIGRIR